MDGTIKIDLVNAITIGLIAYAFSWGVHRVLKMATPAAM
jgi:hypothetical protein